MRVADTSSVGSEAPRWQPAGVRRSHATGGAMRRLMARIEQRVRSESGHGATFRVEALTLGLAGISQARWPGLLWPSEGDAQLYINRDGGFVLQLAWLAKCDAAGTQRFASVQAWHEALMATYPEARNLPLLFGAAFAPKSSQASVANSPWSGFGDLGVALPRVVIECGLRPTLSPTHCLLGNAASGEALRAEPGSPARDGNRAELTLHVFREASESWTPSLALVEGFLLGLSRRLALGQGPDAEHDGTPAAARSELRSDLHGHLDSDLDSDLHSDPHRGKPKDAEATAPNDQVAALRDQVAGPVGATPANASWCDAVETTLAGLSASGLAKVVLAQQRTWPKGHDEAQRVDAHALLKRASNTGRPADALSASEHDNAARASNAVAQAYLVERLGARGGTGRFAWRSGPDLFLAATPELLVGADGERVHSEAVAGTLRPDESADLTLLPDKLRREHSHVTAFIEQTLADAGLKPQLGPLTLRHFGAMRHVLQLIEAKALSGVSPWTLIGALHPTPAVCGVPRAAALEMLAAREGFDRGWYSGVVGWVDGHGRCEASVALRGLLLTPDAVHAFAGAGIVRGSEAVAELSELEAKFTAILEVFGLGQPSSAASPAASGPVDETKPAPDPRENVSASATESAT